MPDRKNNEKDEKCPEKIRSSLKNEVVRHVFLAKTPAVPKNVPTLDNKRYR
jgi:hypothetical protein